MFQVIRAGSTYLFGHWVHCKLASCNNNRFFHVFEFATLFVLEAIELRLNIQCHLVPLHIWVPVKVLDASMDSSATTV